MCVEPTTGTLWDVLVRYGTEHCGNIRKWLYGAKRRGAFASPTPASPRFKMADARIVANRFLELAREERKALTPMQLLKLVYIAHGWMLGLNNRSLINQPVEAWQYGPVVRDVYNGVRHYGRNSVSADIWAPTGGLDYLEDDMVKQTYALYGDMDGIALSNITHMPNTPWAQTYKPNSFGTRIDNDLIAAHYQRLMRERAGAAA